MTLTTSKQSKAENQRIKMWDPATENTLFVQTFTC